MSVVLVQVSKPLVERRRRQRINRCIDELKSLLVSRHQVVSSFTCSVFVLHYKHRLVKGDPVTILARDSIYPERAIYAIASVGLFVCHTGGSVKKRWS